MKLLYKLLRQDPNSRTGIITATSALNIIVNVFIALAKVIVGLLASSVAITSEGINNATDALTSVLTLAGSRLAGKHPDKKHPFGYGRIEYLISLVISVMILVTGAEVLIGAVRRVFEPEELSVSLISILIVAVSAGVKLLLGSYTIRMGKKADSGALEAVGLECRSDSIVSAVTIVTALIFLIFHVSLDAYAGILTSLLILKAGFDVLRETIGDLLGRPGEEELAEKLYREIRATDGVINAADMMLHNYGPDAYSGSVNLEIDHNKTVGEVYGFLHRLQLKIMHEHKVTMVFGIYAVDNDHEDVRRIREAVSEFIRAREHVKSYHAVYLDEKENRIYCDLVVDYELKDWEKLRAEFTDYMRGVAPDRALELTIETEYV